MSQASKVDKSYYGPPKIESFNIKNTSAPKKSKTNFVVANRRIERSWNLKGYEADKNEKELDIKKTVAKYVETLKNKINSILKNSNLINK